MLNNQNNLILEVNFVTSLKTLFRGQARSIASSNTMGPFTILPGHAQFMSMLENQPLTIVDQSGKTLKYPPISKLVLYVADNKVSVFANEAAGSTKTK